ncbi:MAG: hypothetical protein ACREEM_13905 [Blastocatellia bacterium]
MTRTITLTISLFLTTALCLAQAGPDAKPAASPTLDQVLDRYVEALGGKAAIEKLTSRTAKGRLEMASMGLKGTIEIYATAGDKTLTVLNLAGIGEIREGYGARSGWSRDPINGFREKKGVELALVKRGSVFHRDLKLRELYAKMELKGKEKAGERDAWLVIATPAEGAPEKMYFDTQNGLMIRSDVEIESPQGKMPFEIYFEDYRAVDGMKIPFVVRRVHPAMSMTVRLDEVKHNLAIEDAKFDRPAAQ